jgi:hypothetical protein
MGREIGLRNAIAGSMPETIRETMYFSAQKEGELRFFAYKTAK